jgi:hypothetical protein
MKKKIVFFVGFALTAIILAACGAQAEPEPIQDLINAETQIAQAVMETSAVFAQETTTSLTIEAQVTQFYLETQAAMPTDTPLPTALPTDTPPPPTETPTASPTPENTPDGTATITLTPDVNDPKNSLGNATFSDAFENGSSWFEYSTSQSSVSVEGGELLYTIYQNQQGSIWTLSWMEVKNYYVEVIAETPTTCSGKDRYGIIFRAPDTDQGYIYAFSCDGSYRLSSWDGSLWTVLVNWTSSDAINAGPNQINRVGVWVEDQQIKLYANNVLLNQLQDNKFDGENRMGLVLGSENTNDFTVRFDNFRYWALP